MSISVALDDLRARTRERGSRAYVLTVSDDGRSHAVHAAIEWQGDAIVVEVGRRSAANAAARPSVSLLFPVRDEDDYSLIVDGTVVAAANAAQRLLVTPVKAVLHRPAPRRDSAPAGCDSDCVNVLPEEK